MSTIAITNTVAANSVSGNVLSGQLYEFLSSMASVSVYVSAAATGVYARMSIGGDTVLNEALVSDSNHYPVVPDDQISAEGGMPGDRLFLEYRNSTGAPIVVRTLIDITPVG